MGDETNRASCYGLVSFFLRGATKMDIKSVFLSSFLLVSSQVNANGIDVLSEYHHLWGQTTRFPPTEFFSFDVVANQPISFSTDQITPPDGTTFYPVEAEAGDFRVRTNTFFAARLNAYAESSYRFTPEWTQLSVSAFGEGVGWIDSFDYSYSILTLLDTTTGDLLLSTMFGERPDDANPVPAWHYNFSDTYLFDVNPNHVYELNILSGSLSHELRRGDTILQAELSAVPIPAVTWLLGTALIGLLGFSKRSKSI